MEQYGFLTKIWGFLRKKKKDVYQQHFRNGFQVTPSPLLPTPLQFSKQPGEAFYRRIQIKVLN